MAEPADVPAGGGDPAAGAALTYDVAIIGGGIVGCAAAAWLGRQNLRAVLVERGQIGSGASGRNAGVVEHPYDPEQLGLYEESLALLRELGVLEAGEPKGVLLVASEEERIQALVTWIRREHPELQADLLDPGDLRRVEPLLADDIWACRLATGFPIPPREATNRYAAIAKQSGCDFRLETDASLTWDGERCIGVVAGGEHIPAGAVLVAAGAESCSVIDPTGEWTPIRPNWGVMFELATHLTPRHILIEANVMDSQIGAAADTSQHAFTLVDVSGKTTVGSTFLWTEPELSAWQHVLLERAARFVPRLRGAGVRDGLACARPRSIDGRPLLGRVPGREGLFIAAGHGGRGITLGPASAQIAARALCAGADTAIPEPLRASRFPLPDPAAAV